jgi:hypothetical protein
MEPKKEQSYEKEKIKFKHGTKIYEPWNKKRNKASAKKQIESKRGTKK